MGIKGFFSKKQTQSTSRINGKPLSCVSCGLYRDKLHPKLIPYGNFKKGIMVIGQSPGQTEDKLGKPWQGKAGQRKKQTLANLGIDLFEDCISLNAVNCRPIDKEGKNRTPTDYEIACCRERVLKAINQYEPKLIILAGGEAVKSLIQHRWKGTIGGITLWRGWTIPDRDYKAWICPVFHPSYVNRMVGSASYWNTKATIGAIYQQDLARAINCLKRPFPNFTDERDMVEIIEDRDKLSAVLDKLNTESELIAIDFETTGLKPHAEGHCVVCISIADRPDHCFAFMTPKDTELLEKIRRLFANKRIKKTAHNMVFEHTWAQVRLGVEIQNWVHCSMQAAHILDNRQGITGLKFQSYVQFGLCDYASTISPFLMAVDTKSANSKNRVLEYVKKYGSKELLIYCGLDTIVQRRLALQQMEQIYNTNENIQGS